MGEKIRRGDEFGSGPFGISTVGEVAFNMSVDFEWLAS